jgi:hypothetical protein
MTPAKFQLEIALRCDFADIFEVKSSSIVRRGPDHHGVVRAAPASAHDLSQRRLQPRRDDYLGALAHKGGVRQRTVELGGKLRTGRGLALLFTLHAGRRRLAFCFTQRFSERFAQKRSRSLVQFMVSPYEGFQDGFSRVELIMRSGRSKGGDRGQARAGRTCARRWLSAGPSRSAEMIGFVLSGPRHR